MASDQDRESPVSTRKRRGSIGTPPNFSLEDGMNEYLTISSSSRDTENARRSVQKDFSKYLTEIDKLDDGPPACYQLRANRVNLDRLPDEDSKLRRFTVGNRDPQHQNRTVLLVGATGSGKSTLINTMVNFVMGVKFEDRVWFEIITDKQKGSDVSSQTSAVSVYEVFGFEGKTLPYSLTIIDTPGYGDTESIENDEIITKLLQDLFCVPEGVDTINAVGLVLKATENRLDERMAYIYNSVTSLFGKDIEKNIVALMTHSDGRKPKLALRALDEAKVKCARNKNNEPLNFCFNNCQKEKTEDEGEVKRAQSDFEMSNKGITELTEFLEHCPSVSLKTTVEVMKERTRLTACIQNLEERIKTIELKQETIEKNKLKLLEYEEEMKKNQNFITDVDEVYRDKEKIPWKWFRWFPRATACNNCEQNCHHPGCTVAWGPAQCEVMKDGKCTSCEGKCPVTDHVKESWIYVDKTRTVRTTHEEMKAKYEESKMCKDDVKRRTPTLLEDLDNEKATFEKDKKQYLNEAFEHIQKLEQIALNVDSVFTYVHLDFLMDKMKDNEDAEKVKKLEKMRDRMDERNKAGANYFRKCIDFLKSRKKR